MARKKKELLEYTKEELRKIPKSLIIGQIRRLFFRTKLFQKALYNAISEKKGVRGGKRYDCAICGGDFPITGVQVDHIEPVIPLDKSNSEMSLDEIVDRMWCDESNLRVICKECHEKITSEQREERKKHRNFKKLLTTTIIFIILFV
jgi:transposase-like protein